ncbi:phosphoadenylyl-sulfate reductase [Pacificimonas sp. WHA3]|uniref:Adenosine 5'-phosphosulfate reductase n=1 Tax=Pacificimonas pallii TaxID=2827236 RepID=A0ABS6SGA8_9SPHN|nr:phosphoadenylyl-sulfate reductase [Pacificimonas pallii]MBV7257450.1 phosphoadenylyl-sulfate reductase [Pacificimonas pallii]
MAEAAAASSSGASSSGNARRHDRLDIGYTDADAAVLNAGLAALDTLAFLEVMLTEIAPGELAVVSSFGAESAVLLDLVSRVDPATPVVFLDTGKHFPETLAYRDTLVERLGLTNVISVMPGPDDIAAKDSNGLRWSFDPDGCCELRKVRPLARVLTDFGGSITGRKSFQAATRAELPRVEAEDGRLKVNPIIDWQKADIEAWFAANDLPRHPLEAEGYPSIGCSPCTSKVKPGEDPRSGRWRGWDKTECGIHTDDGEVSELPSF